MEIQKCDLVSYSALHHPWLEAIKGRLKWSVVRSICVDRDSHGALVYVLPMMRGVHEGIVEEHQEAERADLVTQDATCWLLEGGDNPD